MKYHKLLKNVEVQDEKRVCRNLKKEGFYSEEHIFPIASLHFELTSQCNMACKHCYNNSGINNGSDVMTPDKWILFSEYLVKQGGVFECILSGGEPLLLGDELFRIMDVLHDDGTIFYLITNGYLLTKEMVQKFKQYRYHRFQVSIDGVNAEYHDTFRKRRGSWKKAVEGAKFVAESGLPLKIAHCVTPYNIHDIDKMCAFAYDIGATSILVGELCFSGRAAVNKDLLLSNEQREILFEKVKENRLKFKDKMVVKCSNKVKDGLERHLKHPNSGAIIRPNGDVRIDGMAPFVLGNILSEDFATMWEKKLFDAWKNPMVLDFINNFDENDRNYSIINYLEEDIYL